MSTLLKWIIYLVKALQQFSQLEVFQHVDFARKVSAAVAYLQQHFLLISSSKCLAASQPWQEEHEEQCPFFFNDLSANPTKSKITNKTIIVAIIHLVLVLTNYNIFIRLFQLLIIF